MPFDLVGKAEYCDRKREARLCANVRNCAIAGVLLSALVGCGKSDGRLKVYPVNGTVTVKGQPAKGAKIMINSTDAARRGPGMPMPTGTVVDDGSFTLNSYASGDGAPAGEYNVAIVWPEPVKRPNPNIPDAPPARDRLNGKYSVPDSSGLKASVREEPTELPPFELP